MHYPLTRMKQTCFMTKYGLFDAIFTNEIFETYFKVGFCSKKFTYWFNHIVIIFFKDVKLLNTSKIRYATWYPYPQASVAELDPPSVL